MDWSLTLVAVIVVALFFDFTNGFHDTANAIGTAIGTRALSPRLAVGLSAVLNLVGAIVTTQLLHAEVANTVGSLVAPAGGVTRDASPMASIFPPLRITV